MGWFKKDEAVPEIAPAPTLPTLPELPKKERALAEKELPELPTFPNNPANDNLTREMVKSAVTDNLSPGENEVNGGIPTNPSTTEALPGESLIPPKPSIADTKLPLPQAPVASAIPEPPQAPIVSTIPEPPQAPVASAIPEPPQAPVASAIPEPPRQAPQEQPLIPSISSTASGQKPSITSSPKKTESKLGTTKEDKPESKSSEPIYIRIDKFQSAQKNFEQVKEKVMEIESLIQKVKDIKSQEEVELNGWTEDIENIKARLADVDSEIFNQL